MNDRQFEFQGRLAVAAAELRRHAPPATLLPAIHRALDRRAADAAVRPARWFRWSVFAAAGSALAAIVIALGLPLQDGYAPSPDNASTGFVSVADNDAWTQASRAEAAAWLVATDLPQARLAALGLPYDPSRGGERVPAQLLLQPSGDVLAVRFAR